jgi:hypothetical protein
MAVETYSPLIYDGGALDREINIIIHDYTARRMVFRGGRIREHVIHHRNWRHLPALNQCVRQAGVGQA